MLDNKPKLLATVDIMKVNRSMSYLAFVYKDIKNYVLKMVDDNTYYEEIRNARERIYE